jgi:DNA-binding NarL/FixJ family response regulator
VDDDKWHDGVLRVLVCDEFPLFRRQVVIALEAAPDVDVVGEAPDADVARAGAEHATPDVIVLGTRLPPGGAASAAVLLRRLVPAVEMVLAVDPEDVRDDLELRRALRTGVVAVLPRDAVTAHAAPVVRAAAAHRPVLDARTAGIALDECNRARLALEPPERAVLEHLAGDGGITSAAEALGLPVVTASNLVANALRKLRRSADTRTGRASTPR